jgi:predicted DCC family thiol-disulfide oxidoreductase YuxK
MKTNNLTLYYDKDCPLCVWYTGIFLKYKLLKPKGRICYNDAILTGDFPFDEELARNKIALYNADTKQVMYGIDSMLEILAQAFPFIKIIGKFAPIYWFLNQLYNFISYNRKIVAPVHMCASKTSCIPTRSWFWRIVFLFFCGVVVHFIVTHFFTTYISRFYIGNKIYGDFILFTFQALFQVMCCFLFKEKNIYDYLGHLCFVSFIGALILQFFSIGLHLFSLVNINVELLGYVCYGMVFMIMFFMHYKRVHDGGFDSRLTYSWIILRLLIYPLAFKLFN